MNNKQSTSDFYFVAYLYSWEIQPVEIKEQDNRYVFYYDIEDYDEIHDDYYNRVCLIEPIQYQQGIRWAKTIIYNYKRGIKC